MEEANDISPTFAIFIDDGIFNYYFQLPTEESTHNFFFGQCNNFSISFWKLFSKNLWKNIEFIRTKMLY